MLAAQLCLLWALALAWLGRQKDADRTFLTRALKLALVATGAVLLWKTSLLIRHPGIGDGRLLYPFDTSADAVLIGCSAALSWAHPRLRPRIRTGLRGPWTPGILVVALAVALSTVSLHEHSLFSRLMAWVVSLPMFSALVATLILALVVEPGAAPARLLSHPILRWVGRLSYGMYLWHVVSFEGAERLGGAIAGALPSLRPGIIELLTIGAGVVLTLALACLSYNVIERPFLRIKGRFNPVTAVSAPDP